MSFFQQVEGEACVIVHNGIYRQTDLYRRGNQLFAKSGTGFVRLRSDGSTSKPKMRLDFMSWEGELHRTPLGSLCVPHDGSIPLEKPVAQNLLGAG